MNNEGYTLLEISLVITIFLIIACTSLPHFHFFSTIELHQELKTFKSLCCYLRNKAIITQQPLELHVFPADNTYSYPGVHSQRVWKKLGNNIQFGFHPGIYGPPSKPSREITDISSFKKNNEHYIITFYPTMTIDPGCLYVIHATTHAMGALTSSIEALNVIRIYHLKSNQWKLQVD